MGGNYHDPVNYESNEAPASAVEPESAPSVPKVRKQLPQRSVNTFWEKVLPLHVLLKWRNADGQ